MRELFDSLLTRGQRIEVTVGWEGTMSTISCTFLSADKDYIAIRLDDGMIRIFRRDVMLYVDVPGNIEIPDSVDTEMKSDVEAAIAEKPSNAGNNQGEYFTEDRKGEVYNITPTLAAPKIIGKIDLSQFPSKTKNHSNNQEDESGNLPGDSDKWLPANGYIERLGPQFGFIRVVGGDSPNIYLPRNEFVSMAGVLTPPEEGDHVIFTYGMNSRGPVAKCVHKQCTVYTQERLISRLSNCDPKNANLLRRQLAEAYDNDALCDRPEARVERSIMVNNFRQRNSALGQEVIEAIDNGENVSSHDLLTSEKIFARTLDYDDYLRNADKLLRYSCKYDRPRAYQLYLRITKTARDNGDEETALKYVQEACDFYINEPGSYKTFSDLGNRIRDVYAPESSIIPTDEEIAEVEARSMEDDE